MPLTIPWLIPLSLLAAGCALATENTFTYPIPGEVQHFTVGDTVDVAWKTTFKTPFLQLFCGGINNPIANFTIDPATTSREVELDLAAQTNCYLHMQDGPGLATELPSFGTGIFAIQPNNGTNVKWCLPEGSDEPVATQESAECKCDNDLGSSTRKRWNHLSY